ncbi:Crp/Fnr family transcriptional regulator [Hymenobacter lapidiphilus]|uniref:Crp/Fnr family transcriptional regulator n=1 Tax=Hymenobacter lapidiphilus TaxID=2608003 RepID=A0A7Y7U781_9BACT|nr:Crp/Fnr family transcriptional regulator [Hymenobacter lapidiphilus]NVO32579.1 Crp/Fnr family transcriptional regulator [Hymenobacter lapidiphilus]
MNRFSTPQCHSCPSYHLSLLHCCGKDEQEEIGLHKTAQQYVAGQVIFREGSRALGLYCVHDGIIKISKTGGDGKEQIVRLAKGGDMLGYRGLVTGTLHSASAVALDTCTVCLVRKEDFFQEMSNNSVFSNGLIQLLSKTLGETEERMLHLAYKPVRERLAEALLLLLRTYRSKDQPDSLSFSITREDLGALMGTTKETSTRMLSEFKAEGMLSTHGSAITILDTMRLVNIATQYD